MTNPPTTASPTNTTTPVAKDATISENSHDAYRGSITTTFRNGRVHRSVRGVGLMITDQATGRRAAAVTVADGVHRQIDPEVFEKLYLHRPAS